MVVVVTVINLMLTVILEKDLALEGLIMAILLVTGWAQVIPVRVSLYILLFVGNGIMVHAHMASSAKSFMSVGLVPRLASLANSIRHQHMTPHQARMAESDF